MVTLYELHILSIHTRVLFNVARARKQVSAGDSPARWATGKPHGGAPRLPRRNRPVAVHLRHQARQLLTD